MTSQLIQDEKPKDNASEIMLIKLTLHICTNTFTSMVKHQKEKRIHTFSKPLKNKEWALKTTGSKTGSVELHEKYSNNKWV